MTHPSLVGTVLGDRYRIERMIGQGAVGAVYEAVHLHLGEKFAVKVLHAETSESPEILARFEREAQAAARIKHPNVAAATDFGQAADGSFYLVLEYIDGKSLREALQSGTLEVPRTLRILREITLALERAHSLGIVHRDLKPENIMLVTDAAHPETESVKVLDFGIAKVPTLLGGAKGEVATQRGLVYGTPEYMAPEQALGEEVDARADLYALGVMAYEMLAGVRPFANESKVALLGMQVTAPFPDFASRAPGVVVPKEMEDFIRKMMSKKAADRFPDARSAREEIERLLAFLTGAMSAATRVDSGEYGSPGPPVSSPILPEVPLESGSFPQGSAALPWAKAHAKHVVAVGALGVLVVGMSVFALCRPSSPERQSAAPTAASMPVVASERPSTVDSSATTPEPADSSAAPNDARAEFVRAVSTKNVASALRFAKQWATSDVHASEDTEWMKGFRALAPLADDATLFPFLETELGSAGVDVLYDFAYTDARLGASARAKAGLAKKSVRSKASPAGSVALDLREAVRCEAKRKLLGRAQRDGDARTLALLQPLTNSKGCSGFAGVVRDCFPCLRRDGQLEAAIAAISKRSARH